jgi:hypothetical protein
MECSYQVQGEWKLLIKHSLGNQWMMIIEHNVLHSYSWVGPYWGFVSYKFVEHPKTHAQAICKHWDPIFNIHIERSWIVLFDL